jgi:hypothetical protein
MKAAQSHGTYLFSICFSPTCFHLYRVRNGNANIRKGITIRAPECLSSRLNWVPPTPSPQSEEHFENIKICRGSYMYLEILIFVHVCEICLVTPSL